MIASVHFSSFGILLFFIFTQFLAGAWMDVIVDSLSVVEARKDKDVGAQELNAYS
jgi:hypothetical protein